MNPCARPLIQNLMRCLPVLCSRSSSHGATPSQETLRDAASTQHIQTIHTTHTDHRQQTRPQTTHTDHRIVQTTYKTRTDHRPDQTRTKHDMERTEEEAYGMQKKEIRTKNEHNLCFISIGFNGYAFLNCHSTKRV